MMNIAKEMKRIANNVRATADISDIMTQIKSAAEGGYSSITIPSSSISDRQCLMLKDPAVGFNVVHLSLSEETIISWY